MSTKVRIQLVLGLLVGLAAPVQSSAQIKLGAKATAKADASGVGADGSAQIDADGEYDAEIQQGLRVHQPAASSLSQAARDGRSVVIGRDGAGARRPVATSRANYIVREGDTLYEICERIWGDPYLWPKLWALNGQITNPNWIYPGDVLRLREQAAAGAVGEASSDAEETLAIPTQMAVVPVNNAVVLRNRGFVDKEVLQQSGSIVGSHRPIAMLAQFDEAYVEFGPEARVKPGARFVAFEILGTVDTLGDKEDYEDEGSDHGKLVEILGDVKVISYDPEKAVARVYIEESVKPISRGTLIGPVHRRFDMIPPVTNGQTVYGRIIASLDPTLMVATHQVVFVDIGTEDGVRDGNRIFAVEQRDGYRKSLDEPDDHDGYPTEVIAELRVIEARPNTSTCLITSSLTEIAKGQAVLMRAGY